MIVPTRCPRCGGELNPEPALNARSRVDNETHICERCGMKEAFANQFAPQMDLPPVDKPIIFQLGQIQDDTERRLVQTVEISWTETSKHTATVNMPASVDVDDLDEYDLANDVADLVDEFGGCERDDFEIKPVDFQVGAELFDPTGEFQ